MQSAVTEPPSVVPEFDNCKVLHDTLQLSWKVDSSSSSVQFQLCGCTATDPRFASAYTNNFIGEKFAGPGMKSQERNFFCKIHHINEHSLKILHIPSWTSEY